MGEAGMVIVGGGMAGARAAVVLRDSGWQGAITLIGEEGRLPYDRPPLSKSAITDDGEPQPTVLLDEGAMASLNVTWLGNAHVDRIDRPAHEAVLADGRRIPYGKLLIATGATARKLTMLGAERALTLRTFEDMQALRQKFQPGVSVAIIGGGFIGLELATSAVKRGCAVTVIEAQPRILLRAVPEEIAAVVASAHAHHGVRIITGAQIDLITADSVLLKDGTAVKADLLVAGIGAAPSVALAEASGLAIDNGIVCDNRLRTSDPDIYAAGDCVSFPHPTFDGKRMRLEAWRAAQDQAGIAAQNMMGGDKPYDAIPWFWSDQFDLSLQIAGLPAEGVTTVRRPLKDNAFILMYLAADGRLVGASGIGVGNSVARDIRLAEMLIAKGAKPDPAALADPDKQLKALLKG
jgi:3-phenylpropionate/trans-cinnamate dioxygenase ferredoxin reductase component